MCVGMFVYVCRCRCVCVGEVCVGVCVCRVCVCVCVCLMCSSRHSPLFQFLILLNHQSPSLTAEYSINRISTEARAGPTKGMAAPACSPSDDPQSKSKPQRS